MGELTEGRDLLFTSSFQDYEQGSEISRQSTSTCQMNHIETLRGYKYSEDCFLIITQKAMKFDGVPGWFSGVEHAPGSHLCEFKHQAGVEST